MTYLPDTPYGIYESLRIAAIREPMDATASRIKAISSISNGGKSQLTLTLQIDGLDSTTGEVFLGYNEFIFEYTEPISRYLKHPDVVSINGNSYEGVVGGRASSAMTRGRFDIHGPELISAMIERRILPGNILVDGYLNTTALLHHILLGRHATDSW